MAAHRYWRIRSPTRDPYGLAEVEMRTSAGGADQTGSGTAIASGNYTGYPPSNCYDNNNSTLWTTFTVPLPSGGHWIGYDFGSGNDKDIVEFTLRARNDGFHTEAPLDPIFEYSDDASTWTRAGDAGGAAWTSGEVRTYNIEPPITAFLSQSGIEVVRTGSPPALLSQSGIEVAYVVSSTPAAARPVVFVCT